MEFGDFTQIAEVQVQEKQREGVLNILEEMSVKVEKLSPTHLLIGIPREKEWLHI